MAAATSRTRTHHRETTIFSRLDRLDVMVGHLEEIKGSTSSVTGGSSSSLPSTPVSDGGCNSSFRSSSLWLPQKSCRPADEVLVETKNKGNLIRRLQQLEDHVLELSFHLKDEVEEGRKSNNNSPKDENKKLHGMKGFKSLVKSCVKRGDYC